MSSVVEQQQLQQNTTLTTNSTDKNNNNVCTDAANGIPTRKRIRFDTAEQAPNMADKDAVKDFVSRSLESLPPTIKETATKTCNRFHSLCVQARNKQQTLRKFDNADYVPQSAKIGFTLKSNKRVEETATFKTQAATVEQLVEQFRQQLKAATKVVTNEELSILKQDIQDHFFQGLYDIAMLILINEDADRARHPARALSLRIIKVHGASLLKHTGLTATDIYEKYKTYFKEPEVHVPDSLPEELKVAVAPHIDPAHSILDCIFVKSWDLAEAKLIEKEKKSAMDVYIKSRTADTATEAAAMEVENEQSISSKKIKDLIKSGVREQTKQLQTQVNTLQNKLSSAAKNNRGASPVRASSKKKNTAKDNVKNDKEKNKKKKSDKRPSGKDKKTRGRQGQQNKRKNKKCQTHDAHDSAAEESSASSSDSSASRGQRRCSASPHKRGRRRRSSRNTRRS